MKILHILNTLLLTGILAILILIFFHLRQPIKVDEPIPIEGWNGGLLGEVQPVRVAIDEQPVEVEISR